MRGPEARSRPARATVDLAAVRHNVAEIRRLVEPAEVCVVVKANGYGHGAIPVARAAVDAGATWLGVALVEEGLELRAAGIAGRVLVLSEPTPDAMPAARQADLTPTLYSAAGVAAAAAAAGGPDPWPVHLKVDTGMHRVGASPQDIGSVVAAARASGRLHLEGLWTHLAVADEPDRPDGFSAAQLDRFAAVRAALAGDGFDPPLVHAANSAGALVHPDARLDLVRCGIAVYGLPPGGVTGGADLRPALGLSAEITFVKTVAAGEGISYGLHYAPTVDTVVATVPLGYADGVTRRLAFTGGEVLVGGRRCPIAGAVTMDQMLVDCGPGAEVAPGDDVVLIGRQGREEITATDWADRLGTINYEVVCGIGPRVPRVYTG